VYRGKQDLGAGVLPKKTYYQKPHAGLAASFSWRMASHNSELQGWMGFRLFSRRMQAVDANLRPLIQFRGQIIGACP
jgi:hypothetical protein